MSYIDFIKPRSKISNRVGFYWIDNEYQLELVYVIKHVHEDDLLVTF